MSEVQPVKAPSDAWKQCQDYSRIHSSATLMLFHAANDYAAARCLCLSGFFEGLVLGAQAIEKFLKAYLLLADPIRPVRKLSHGLSGLLGEVEKLHPALGLGRFSSTVQKFRGHYQTRYPDNADASKSMTTADLRELDELVIFLNENLPCPKNVKYRTGLYSMVTMALNLKGTITPYERWIKAQNLALGPLMPRIYQDYADVMAELYPNRPT